MMNELNGNESGLIGYWKLNETSGNNTNDATSNNNDGTLINMPANPRVQIFTESSVSLTHISNGSLDWGDYDNDGDLDIHITDKHGLSFFY